MCGILGIAMRKGVPTPTGLVARLLPLLHHRGPDDCGVIKAPLSVFGHTRLAILGVTRPEARQPVHAAGSLLTFNGEIYNFRELNGALRGHGLNPTDTSDTETLFLCLRHWGVEKTLARVDGMFAFAYHDAHAGVTYLARDPLGEKPLYWALTPRGLWFASEIKVLLATGEVSPAPNLARIDDFLYTAKVNGAATIFRDITELEPGTMLTFKAGAETPSIAAYWRLEDGLERSVVQGNGATDLAFLSYMERTVASRRISDVPVGVLLSGGIDSNALVELLFAARPSDKLDLFFADNADDEVSERADMELFVEHLRSRYPEAGLHVWTGLQSMPEYMETLERLTWHYDEPIQFHNSPLLGNLCRLAHQRRIKVLFSGEGMDELLYGYVRFDRTRLALEGEVDSAARLGHLYHGGGVHSVDLVKRLTRGVAEGPEATEPWQWLDSHLSLPLDRLQLAFSQKYRLQTLLQRQDRIGMAESVEIRVPYLAPWFVIWVNQLSQERKFDAATGRTKVILRNVMRDRLPERILTKPKDGFSSDMMVWLRTDALRQTVTDLVSDPAGFSQTYLDGPFARQLVEDHFACIARQDVLVWNLLSLELWHRTFGHGVSCPQHDAAASGDGAFKVDRVGMEPEEWGC